MLTEKRFALPHDKILPLVTNGGGCLASDRITVDGCPVGYMYREAGTNELDNGWRFLGGDESEEYMDNASNHGAYDVNTIANHDPEIIQFLTLPFGTAISRTTPGGPLEVLETDEES